MFCIYCGKQLADGETCSCRTPQPEIIETQPTYEQPAYSQPTYTQPVYSQPVYTQPAKTVPKFEPDGYTDAITSVIKPPITVFFALLLTFGFAVKLIGVLEFDIFLLLGMIAAWIINSQSHTYGFKPRSKGYKLMSTVELFNIIIQSVSTLAVFVILTIVIVNGSLNVAATELYRFFNGNVSGYRVTLTPLAIVSICMIVISFCGLVLYYHISLRNNILYIRKRLAQKPIRERFAMFPNILLILHGTIQIAFAVIIFMSKSIIMHYINKSFGGNWELALAILTIGIQFGIPVALFLLGIARILAGSALLRLSCKFKKVSKQ